MYFSIAKNKYTNHIYEQVEEKVGEVVTITGEMYETSYQDKKTGEWINSYCICISKMEG